MVSQSKSDRSVTANSWTKGSFIKHLSSEELELYILNRATPRDCEITEVHLLHCDSCQDAAFDAELYLLVLRSGLRSTCGEHHSLSERGRSVQAGDGPNGGLFVN